jgi:tetratricopeptide (TPR) repeat protein
VSEPDSPSAESESTPSENGSIAVSEWGDGQPNIQRDSAGLSKIHGHLRRAALAQPPRPSRIGCMRLLAKTLFAKKTPRAELKVLRQIVDELRRVRPPQGHDDSLYFILVMRRIGTCLLSLGEAREAISQLRICIKAADAWLLSHQVIEVKIARVMLATCLANPADVDEALQYLEHDLPEVHEHTGNTAMVRNAYVAKAHCFKHKEQLMNAVEGYQRAASLYKEAGELEQSETMLQAALKIQGRLVQHASQAPPAPARSPGPMPGMA